ncbi:MAG: hypothetical protein CMM47_02170 [Rhodospirillaceae bacterium]|nr:hypothetical protein [Rhodospirillaceae bacterium]
MVKFPKPIEGPLDNGPRHAIYYAPAGDSALHAAASHWLGRDSISGEHLEQPNVAGMEPGRLKEVTADPRRYGFHATLKPPFRLKPGRTADELFAAAERLASKTQAFDITLALRHFSGFFALMQEQSRSDIQEMAAAAVVELDEFRALPSEKELARRRGTGLSAAQETLLQRWGYPYVMGEFRFHTSLSQRITDGSEAKILETALHDHFRDVVGKPHTIDSISIFRQEMPNAPFLQIERFPTAATA